jgi:hypothetical protein
LLEHLEEARQVVGRAAALAQQGGEVAAADEFHGEVQAAAGVAADLVDGHDAGVLQLAADLRLFEEATADVGAVAGRIVEHFQGQLATEVGLFC